MASKGQESARHGKDKHFDFSELAHKLTLTVAEAAALTGMGRHAIQEACNTGELRAIRPGKRRFLINREDLDEWLRVLPTVPLERPALVIQTRGSARW